MNEPIVIGQTRVNVFKREVGEQSGREKVTKIKTGVVTQDFGSFVRVFDNQKDGDPHPNAEVFAVNGRNIWVEYVETLPERQRVFIPPSF